MQLVIGLLIMVLSLPLLAADCKLPGKVIRVLDGDTIAVMDKQRQSHKIRLAGIDAPEKKQPYGKKAKKVLTALLRNKRVCIEWHKQDRYKRKVGIVWLDQVDINLQMLHQGLSWHFKKYAKEQSAENQRLYAAAERTSKSKVIGLWQEPDAIAPWDWRDGVRAKKANKKEKRRALQAQRKATPRSDYSCGGKRFCKQMESCKEARFYLTKCSLRRLDRDKDGIPCESICGH